MIGFIKKSAVIAGILTLCLPPILHAMSPRKTKANLQINISKGVLARIPIAFVGFQIIENNADIGSVIKNDLVLSGAFSVLPNYSMGNAENDALSTPELMLWDSYSGAMVVQGNVTTNGTTISVELKMYDAKLRKLLKTGTIQGSVTDWRHLAHLISNAIYKELTGEDGIFDTQIVFVGQTGHPMRQISRIAMIDQDGANGHFLTPANEYCHTPKTSPVSPNIAYAFFNKRRAMLRVHNIQTGQKKILPVKGSGISTDFSSDGRHILFSDACNGSATIGLYDLQTGSTRLLNRGYGGIAVSPSYAPDGLSFVVSSDQDLTRGNGESKRRIGAPRLYIVDQNTGSARPLPTSSGSYLCPSWSPDGRYIAFVKRSKGQYYLGVMNSDGTGERMLASDHVIDYPSWAPNSRMLIFAAQQKRFGPFSLFIVDLTARSLRKLPTICGGQVQGGNHPSWCAYRPKSS
jgi:TolB protein